MNGILLVDKPLALTSHDVVEYVRKTLKTKAGHAGTLDPLATGLLIILIGGVTKLSNYLVVGNKRYFAKMQFGIRTDTWDITGKVIERNNHFICTKEIEDVLSGLIGKIELDVPIYSAKKIKGRKLYDYAREGFFVQTPKVVNNIYNLDLLSYSYPYLTFEVECSHGTYIRSLVCEIAKRLNSIGTLCYLRRTKIGYFSVEDAVLLDQVSNKNIIGLERLIKNRIYIKASAIKKIKNGNELLIYKDIHDIKNIDSLFDDMYIIEQENMLFLYKKENDSYKYVLKVDNTNED